MMKAIIIDMKTYENLPSVICDAIWETFQKSYGATLISRESGEELRRITMTGMLHSTIKAILDDEANRLKNIPNESD